MKQSWEYHTITPQTTKIGNVYFDITKTPSLQTCTHSLDITSIQYKKLQSIHSIRLFSHSAKFNIKRLELIKLKQTAVQQKVVKVTKFGDDSFDLPQPQNNTNQSNPIFIFFCFVVAYSLKIFYKYIYTLKGDMNGIENSYYSILRDGGHLWCRNPLNLGSTQLTATNVFRPLRMLYIYIYIFRAIN